MMMCPSCQKLFVREQEGACFCESCGWLTQVDGEWHSCKEPFIPKDPPTLPEPVPAEPDPPGPPDPSPPNERPLAKTLEPEPRTPEPKVKTYLGGLLTVTECNDEETEETDS